MMVFAQETNRDGFKKNLQKADPHEIRQAQGPDDRGHRPCAGAWARQETESIDLRFRFADLVLESEIPLSELPVGGSGSAQCSIKIGSSQPHPSSSGRWDHHWRSREGAVVLSCARDGDAYRLGVPDLATFLVEDGGRTITCRPHTALPLATLEHLLIDQVLPRVLTHRGRLVIHAGCVVTPHGAVAFLGDSGAGKSTLCAAFARAGFPLVGDDGIVLRPAVMRYEAIATYPGLRLLPDPLAQLFEEGTGASAVAHYTKKRRLHQHTAQLALAIGPQPLRALYLLDTAGEIGIAQVQSRESFVALLRASFQLHLDDPERSGELFWRVATLLDAVPVRRLSFPRDFGRLGKVREAVLDDAARIPVPAS
jgi:hypothetical protein